MKKLPIGIQSIKKILSNNEYVYVDKTRFIKQLIDEGTPHYFLSRPRRFGKSLFLNTLEEVLSGNKELFKDLQIYKSNYSWEKYPVIHLDFSKIANRTPDQLEKAIKTRLEIIAKKNNISIITNDVEVALDTLITGISEKTNSKAVVLIDEYDKPIIDRLNNFEIARANKDILKGFFGVLKPLDDYLKLTFITGISKFSHVSLFSGLNNLNDITMDPEYAEIMGYTEEEVKCCFSEHIQSIVNECNEESTASVLEGIKRWYNGYRFSNSNVCVYNPFSTLNFMNKKQFGGYWYSTGTPSFLIDEIKKHPQSVIPLSGTSVLKSALSDISKFDNIKLSALMFQTGYLTIRDYNSDENSYQLDFPNREVKEAFFNSLIQEFTEVDPLDVSRAAKEVRKDLENLDLECFISKMNLHFAKMPYHVFAKAKEGFYQAVFFTFLEKSGIKTSSEISTNIGRIDLMTETDQLIYIFELKLDKTADIALTQAETKKYRERFAQSEKQTLVIGINFSSKSRNIEGWKGRLFSPSGDVIKDLLPKSKN